jgi:AcrR family transcriptional regulator
MPEVRRQKPTRAEKSAARRSSILAQATAGFERVGYRATQIADVARAAKVAHGTVYRHFENKDDLFRAVVTRAVDEVLDRAAGDDLVALTRATLAALKGRARTLGLEAREVAPDEVARLERGLETAAAGFLDEERLPVLWRAAVLEAARQGGAGWEESITRLFLRAAPDDDRPAARRASGWR